MKKIKFNFKKENLKKGVALLFAIVVSMILFTILAGVLNIALKETIFSTSVKNSNDAFYAADSGVECALWADKKENLELDKDYVYCFKESNSDLAFPLTKETIGNTDSYSFNVDKIGETRNTCAKVTVVKSYDGSDPPQLISTKITSKGYNKGGADCEQSGLKSVERVLEVEY